MKPFLSFFVILCICTFSGRCQEKMMPMSVRFPMKIFNAQLVKSKVQAAWRFRIGSVEEYADFLVRRAERSFEVVWQDSVRLLGNNVAAIQKQMNRTQSVYDGFCKELSSQQKKLHELTNLELELAVNPNLSLEQFRRRYDRLDKTFESAFPEALKKKYKLLKNAEGELTQESRKRREKWIEDSLQKFTEQSLKVTSDLQRQIHRSEKLYIKALDKLLEQQRKADDALHAFKEEQIAQLNEIKKLGEVASVTKKELAAQQAVMQEAVENLKDQLIHFVAPLEEAQAQLETDLRERYQQLVASNRLYEELLARRQSKMYVDKLNDQTLRKVLECLDQGPEHQWELVTDKDGVLVSRKFMPTDDSRGGKYCCVKATGKLNVSPSQIRALFADESRVSEYNPYFGEGRDLEKLDESTTIVWASSPGIFPFKPRDFCTLVHFRNLADGSHIVINRYVEHPDAPVTREYQRARVILGAQIISPIPGKKSACKFVTVTQVDPGGFAPAWILNQICTMGPVSFFKNVERAAKRTPEPALVSSNK